MIVNFNPPMCIVTLKVSELNAPIKRQKLSNPTLCYIQKTLLIHTNTKM